VLVFAAEIVGMGALLLVPLPIPAMIPLVILASIALELRGLGWSQIGLQGSAPLRDSVSGLMLGVLVAGVLALAFGRAGGSDFLLISGNARALIAALLVTLALSAVSEMLFRAYVIASAVRVWGPSGARGGVLIGAVLSTIAMQPTTAVAALASFVVALGYAAFFFASGRRLLLPITVHFAFDGYPIVLEYFG